MSHIVTVAARATDPAAVAAACVRLKLPPPRTETVTYFDRSVQTGLAVRPPGFVYPVVCDTETGDLYHDTYEGRWGDESFVGRLLQAYAVEAAKLQARALGHRCKETALADGSVRLTVTAGAAGFGGTSQYLAAGEAAEMRIEITVTPEGDARVETKGFAGPACEAVSKPYEEALGVATAERRTPEYHAAATVAQPVEQRA